MGSTRDMELEGRTVLVTGASRGIGLAIASLLAQEPVRLLVGVRSRERYEEPGGGKERRAVEVRPLVLDLSSRESIERAWAEQSEELGRVDVLVNNAGEFAGGRLERIELDQLYAAVQANLTGLMHLTQRMLPGMLERGEGKIVNQASIMGYAHFPGTSVYAATKAGVSAFTECLRRELESTGVTTLELITGGYDTDMLREAGEILSEHADPSDWEWQDPGDWAEKIVDAIKSDKDRLEPGGKSQFARLGAKAPTGLMDAVTKRAFDR